MKKIGILMFSFVAFSQPQVYARVGESQYSTNIFLALLGETQHADSKTEKWNIFWKRFTEAINAKDTKAISSMTSKDFYDGGGGTIEQWLEAEVFLNDKIFTRFKNKLKPGAKDFKGYNGKPYKATGKNKSGDLFFEYIKNQWQFGGMVGD